MVLAILMISFVAVLMTGDNYPFSCFDAKPGERCIHVNVKTEIVLKGMV